MFLEGTKVASSAICKGIALLESSKTLSFERSAVIPLGNNMPGSIATKSHEFNSSG